MIHVLSAMNRLDFPILDRFRRERKSDPRKTRAKIPFFSREMNKKPAKTLVVRLSIRLVGSGFISILAHVRFSRIDRCALFLYFRKLLCVSSTVECPVDEHLRMTTKGREGGCFVKLNSGRGETREREGHTKVSKNENEAILRASFSRIVLREEPSARNAGSGINETKGGSWMARMNGTVFFRSPPRAHSRARGPRGCLIMVVIDVRENNWSASIFGVLF